MAILFCFAACKNSSSSEDYYKNFSDPSQTTPAKENADGIYIKFAIPEDGISYDVHIDGIGQVTENYFDGNMAEEDFFYPFVDKNTEYTVRVAFKKNENIDDDGYTIETPDHTIGGFEVKVKSGANSKGLVRLADFGEVDVKNNGDFKFTKKPTFENENLLSENWVLDIGLNEGVSWEHPNRRSKWLTEIDIPSKELLGKTYNFYTYPRPWGDVTKVDFICYRPKMYYTYGGKEYKYQWDNKLQDTNCRPEAELWTDLDITNSTDVTKIQGTWKCESYGSITYHREEKEYTFDANFTEILKIEAPNVYETDIDVLTKSDGTVFTEEEKQNCWRKFGENLWENEDPNYYIATISSDGKTVTTEQYEVYTLSEYFADYKSGNSTRHYDLKLFADSLLRIIQSGTWSNGEDYNYWDDYKKQ